jgi:hypothetical protein
VLVRQQQQRFARRGVDQTDAARRAVWLVRDMAAHAARMQFGVG